MNEMEIFTEQIGKGKAKIKIKICFGDLDSKPTKKSHIAQDFSFNDIERRSPENHWTSPKTHATATDILITRPTAPHNPQPNLPNIHHRIWAEINISRARFYIIAMRHLRGRHHPGIVFLPNPFIQPSIVSRYPPRVSL